MEFGLGMAPELSLTLVANETLGFLAGLEGCSFRIGICFGLGFRFSSSDLSGRFVLVLLQPLQGSLHWLNRQ